MTTSQTPTAQEWRDKHRKARQLNVVLAVLVVFLGLVVAAEYLPDESSGAATSAQGEETAADSDEQEEADYVRRDADDPMAIGDVDAPIVLSEWIDMRCPFCAVFSRDTLPVLVEEYVDTGRVRIEFHDVAYFGDESEDSAVAARAAGRQGRYVEFVTAVFDAAPERGHPEHDRDTLIGVAEEAGVPDIDRFTADLDDDELRTQVQQNTSASQQLGVNSVPFFVTRGRALAGAHPVDLFRDLLDDALTKVE